MLWMSPLKSSENWTIKRMNYIIAKCYNGTVLIGSLTRAQTWMTYDQNSEDVNYTMLLMWCECSNLFLQSHGLIPEVLKLRTRNAEKITSSLKHCNTSTKYHLLPDDDTEMLFFILDKFGISNQLTLSVWPGDWALPV